MLVNIDLLRNWNIHGKRSLHGYDLRDSVRIEYPTPENAVGWYPKGFERGNDSALEAMGWYGLKLGLHAHAEETEVSIEAGFADDRTIATRLLLAGLGRHDVQVKLADFEIETCKRNIWRFLKSFELRGNAELVSISLHRGKRVFVQADVRGKSGDVGEDVVYAISLYNCTDTKQSVVVKQVFKGWESLIPVIIPDQFVLEPNGKQDVAVTVRIHDYMVAGGHENTVLRFIPNGDSEGAAEVELRTLRRLAHPYIYHNKEQWRQTREKIAKYPKSM